MTIEEITTTLQDWLTEKSGAAIAPDQHYAEIREVDSFDVLALVLFAEKTYNVKFAASDFEDPRFGTLSGLAALIHSRL
jgi:acyl carrier protein